MVEYNENNDETPRKRKGLFGSRRVRSADLIPAEQAAAPAPDAAPPRNLPAAVSADSALTESPTDEATPVEAVSAPRTRQTAAKSTAPRSTDTTQHPAEELTTKLTAKPTEQPAEPEAPAAPARPSTSLLFQAPDLPAYTPRQQPRDSRGANDRDNRNDTRSDSRGEPRSDGTGDGTDDDQTTVRRRSRRRSGEEDRDTGGSNPRNTVVKVRTPRPQPEPITEPQRIKGSTRLEAKKQRRRDGRDAGRRRPVITEAEFLARRESVEVRPHPDRRARRRRALRALRREGAGGEPHRQRLPRPGTERAPQHGGRIRRHRPWPQRRAVLR